ncbi:threonine/serine dehydratase [soil metagenome]
MSPSAAPLPSLEVLEEAHARVAPSVFRTPLVQLPLQGASDVFAKAENLQRTGSFKIRGASNFLARMTPEARTRGVVAHSSGNHAQGVACAAHAFGIPATIVIPEGAAQVKVARTLAWGAEVVRCENTAADREGTAARIAGERGATVVPPFDHPWIIEGQAGVGLELLDDLPDVANVLVCVGGGGLLAGVVSALRARGSRAQVIGVEPALAADAGASYAAGEIVTWPAEDVNRTVADGVRTQALGHHTFAIIRSAVDAFVSVEEEAIMDAAAWLVLEGHLVVEPTGALALAAYRSLVRGVGPVALRRGSTALIVSGGNVDARVLTALLQRELPR